MATVDEGLRERIAGALADMDNKRIDTNDPKYLWSVEDFYPETDAVLAVLPSAPRVNDITIPRELAERLALTIRSYADLIANPYGDITTSDLAYSDAAAIRAMLEETA